MNGDAPAADRPVHAAGGDGAAVGAEGQPGDLAGECLERGSEAYAPVGVEQATAADRGVPLGDRLAVDQERALARDVRHREDHAREAEDLGAVATGVGVPEVDL